ncbi:hypothetical protein KP509_39G035000 [Ceratopteris richardii]|uniref:Uncharacterized protein n=2 Tax=Ceratopteris richardii TaxID=49495 RepID=A0A8T2PZV4_CERRI|nr:hypothetical protein KP509_39G035000 [Ceratopteris richardii]KAH7277113.1 hypothetical protein KP509_39G035000 [Ceratopteris richardii]
MEDSSKQAPLDDQKIMMRSLSNKVRAYSDDIDQDSDDNAGIHVTKPLQWGQASMGTSESQETRSTRNPRLSDEEREAMATFVRAQGQELMSQLEQQKKRCLIEDAGGNMPDTEAMAMLEKEQMKRLIADRKPRDSEEYMNGNTTTEESEVESSAKISGKGSQDHPQQLHSETDEKNDREYDSNGERFLYRSSTDSDGNHHVQDNTGLYGNLKSLVNEEPAKVLDWLRGEDREMEKEKRILLSKDRILSLLQAFKDGGNGKEGSGAAFNRDDWVPAERLREAERRSSIAEEQIKYFEELFNARDCSSESESEEQLRGALTKAKTMERHFAHMRKFADDKHSDLKRRYSSIISAAREGTKPSWSIISRDHKIGYMNEEKAKKELQDYENQRKRLVQVYSTYNELLKIVKVEHAKRKQAQTKTVQLTSQLERHTATLKRAERVIKHAALKPSLDAFHEPLLSRSQSGLSHDPHLSAFSTTNLRSSLNSQRRSPSPNGFVSFPASASATHQPYTFHDHMDRPRSRATSPAPSVYHHDHHHADRPDSRASSPTPTGHYHHQQIHHNSTQRQLSNDGEFANFQNGFSEASSPRASSAAPLDRSRLSSTGSDLVVPEQRRRKEFQELEDALIQEGRSKGFADVNLYTEKKVVGKEETCWEYRHVHFDFNKSQTGSEGHHDEVESKAAAPSASHVVDDSCTSADQIQVYEERLGTKTTSFHGSHSSHDGVQNSTALNDDERSHLLSSPRKP